ncbi:MAG: chaperone modulator CbpM [Sulfitobacter sp.]|jgi:chaperone modulatory protein CbpM|nr:chaperone modulator CbpM [Sulfitobacter sp.]
MSFDEQTVVAHVTRLSLKELRLWVRRGWVRPAQGPAGPVFDELDIARIRLLCDLRQDMSLPTQALPVVLTLIDRLHQTRRDLQRLTALIDGQPQEVKRAMAAALNDTFDTETGTTVDP